MSFLALQDSGRGGREIEGRGRGGRKEAVKGEEEASGRKKKLPRRPLLASNTIILVFVRGRERKRWTAW